MMEEVCNRFLGVSVPVTPSYDMGADTPWRNLPYTCALLVPSCSEQRKNHRAGLVVGEKTWALFLASVLHC